MEALNSGEEPHGGMGCRGVKKEKNREESPFFFIGGVFHRGQKSSAVKNVHARMRGPPAVLKTDVCEVKSGGNKEG